jgi:SOS-response transcriptional repressor LexA
MKPEDRLFPIDEVPEKIDFCLPISGGNMEPKIHNDQLIRVQSEEDADHGKIGILPSMDAFIVRSCIPTSKTTEADFF